MIFDLLAPPHDPRGGAKKSAIAHPIHVSNEHTKFGWISSNGLGGDSVKDGQTEAIAISPTLFLKKRGDNNPQNNLSLVFLIRKELRKNWDSYLHA